MPQNLNAYTDATTLEGAKQVIAQGPVASQEVIKMLGTNGGGFFNANSAHPFENPTRADQPHPDAADLLDRRGADQRVRPHGRQPASGLGDLRGHGRAVPRRRRHLLFGGSAGQPGLRGIPRRPGAERTAGRRQHGRQGGPLRHCQLGAVRHRHHRRVVRRGEQHARQPAAARRHGADGQHHAGRDHLRRRRFGPLRHAAVRHRGDVRRRADGRPHAGIPRQEARGEGGQDGHARHPDACRCRSWA